MVIMSGGLLAYSRQYGDKIIDQDLISGFLTALASFSTEVKGGGIESLVMSDIRFIYSVGENDTLFVFCCDKDDLEEEVQERINKVKEKFTEMFHDIITGGWTGNTTLFEPFNEVVDDLILLPLKIVVVGEAGVGKTTILGFFPGEEIIELDENDNVIAKKSVEVEGIESTKQIDFFKYDLNMLMEELRFHVDILKSADLVILVVSSGASNLARTKKHLKRLKDVVREGRLVCLANMQDLSDVAYSPEQIQEQYGIKTYGFSAIQEGADLKFFDLLSQMLSEVTFS